MSITIVPIDGNNYEVDGDKKIYHCLIHSVGEDDKKKLRQFVNEIFFSDLNKKRSEEDKSFKELNESERMRRIQEMEEIETKESEQQAAEEHPEDVPLPEKS